MRNVLEDLECQHSHIKTHTVQLLCSIIRVHNLIVTSPTAPYNNCNRTFPLTITCVLRVLCATSRNCVSLIRDFSKQTQTIQDFVQKGIEVKRKKNLQGKWLQSGIGFAWRDMNISRNQAINRGVYQLEYLQCLQMYGETGTLLNDRISKSLAILMDCSWCLIKQNNSGTEDDTKYPSYCYWGKSICSNNRERNRVWWP